MYTFLSSSGWQLLMKAEKLRAKTTWSQRTSNWSYHSNRYKTTIQKTHLHDTNQKVPIICTRSNNHRLAFNQNSDEFVCLDFPADLQHQVIVSNDRVANERQRHTRWAQPSLKGPCHLTQLLWKSTLAEPPKESLRILQFSKREGAFSILKIAFAHTHRSNKTFFCNSSDYKTFCSFVVFIIPFLLNVNQQRAQSRHSCDSFVIVTNAMSLRGPGTWPQYPWRQLTTYTWHCLCPYVQKNQTRKLKESIFYFTSQIFLFPKYIVFWFLLCYSYFRWSCALDGLPHVSVFRRAWGVWKTFPVW